MAWVNRTTRDQAGASSFIVSTGAAHLGPGAYESSPSRRVKPNAAAFGSSTEVERGAVGSGDPATIDHSFVTPGPGAYANANQQPWESPSKLTSPVFQSKTQRDTGTVKTTNQTPGPGAYVKQDTFGTRAKKKQNQISLGSIMPNDTTKTAKIKWARLPSAPSIPTQSQSFGYEQGPYGKLVRHKPANAGHTGRPEDTIGPGEYDPMRGLKSIHKSRATDFSKSRVTRSLEQEIKQHAELPGPGQYIDPAPSASKDTQRASAIFKAATREKAALALGDMTKNPVPGPGSYSGGYKGFTNASKPEHLQFFGSTGSRFEGGAPKEASLSPGPGSYYSPPSFSSERPYAMRRKGKSAPFSCKKERFDHHAQPKEEYLAAPGSYSMPTAMAETLSKVTSRVQTFGSTTKRFDSLSSPAHDTDNHESQLEKEMRAVQVNDRGSDRSSVATASQKAKLSSVFASSSTRFKPLEKAIAPSPGEYEIQASWNAPGATGTFKSSTNRMKQTPSATGEVPGPGSYSVPAAVVHKPIHMARPDVFVGAEPRFKKTLPKVHVPGPGAYSTHTIENDWNRPTYNITIATEMELAMLR